MSQIIFISFLTFFSLGLQAFEMDVPEDTKSLVTYENIVFMGHTTAYWDTDRSTESAARSLLNWGIAQGFATIGTVYTFSIGNSFEESLYYFSEEQIDIMVSSQAGQHQLYFPHLKNIFFAGGNLDRCLCEAIRDVAIGIYEYKIPEVNFYIVKDATYAAWPAFNKLSKTSALDFVNRFFNPSFKCPLQDWGVIRRGLGSRMKMPGVAMDLFYEGELLKTYDLEPSDEIFIEALERRIRVHFIESKDLEFLRVGF